MAKTWTLGPLTLSVPSATRYFHGNRVENASCFEQGVQKGRNRCPSMTGIPNQVIPETLSTILRIDCPPKNGISVHDQAESLSTIKRNQCPRSSGIGVQQSAEYATWRERDLSEERYKYLFIDGVHFKMRVKDSIENIPVLAVIGVNQDGYKTVLALQQGDKESASNWRELFKDLKERGLDSASVELAVMDGLAGLEKVFKEEFSQAQVQRCQVHLARNVLA